MKIKTKVLSWFVPVLSGMILLPASANTLLAEVAPESRKMVEQSIEIRQKTQKERTKWEHEKSDLELQYERLLEQKKVLEAEQQSLMDQEKRLEASTHRMALQKAESIRVQRELRPFLETVFARLETLVENDAPFLKEERAGRLIKLKKTLEDPEITIAEKYRKVMEALFIEAEYGATIEVYQDKIKFSKADEKGTLGDVFRLGRVSLFFLSLDRTICAAYNPGTQQWEILPEKMLPSIVSAVEVAGKRRPAELLALPLGRLASQGGAK